MEERNMPRRPRREKADDQPRNESLVYGKNPVTELLKSGSGVDTVLLAEGMARLWPLTIPQWRRKPVPPSNGYIPTSCAS